MIGLQIYATPLGLSSAGNWTQGFIHTSKSSTNGVMILCPSLRIFAYGEYSCWVSLEASIVWRSCVSVVSCFSWQTAKVVSWWEGIWLVPHSYFLEPLKGFLWLRCQLLVWTMQYSSDLFLEEANRSCRTGGHWMFPISIGDRFLTQVSLMSSALAVTIGFVAFSVVSFEPHSISRKWLE